MRFAGACPLRPNMRFSRTVSHGNTDPSCEIRMPRESGRERGLPSIVTEPASGGMTPAMMFMSVVLPQPEGPTIAMNSLSRTEKLTSATTGSGPLSEGKLFDSPRTSILVRIAPPHPLHPLEQPHRAIEREPDETDDDHAGDHQIVAIPGIARIHDHVAEPRTQRDHFGGDDDEPCDAQADAHADQHLRQHCRNHHLPEERGARDREVLSRTQIALFDRMHTHRRLDHHRKNRRDKDEIDRRSVPDAEPQNG